MPSSFGEADVTINSRIVGKVRVLRLFSDSAVYPRIALDVGCVLYEMPDGQFTAGVPLANYELIDLAGELRLAEHVACVAPVYWSGHDRRISSTGAHPYENQLRLVADLDPWRLERIEAARSGAAPPFWLYLWLGFQAGGQVFREKVGPMRLDVPRETWLEFLAAVRHDEFEIIEVRFDKASAERFRKAVEEVKSARARLLSGDYNDAVAACRRAIEAISLESDIGKEAADWEKELQPATDQKRADHYASIMSKVKQLANLAIHPSAQPVSYSRGEARFIVRTTENLMALVGDLTAKKV